MSKEKKKNAFDSFTVAGLAHDKRVRSSTNPDLLTGTSGGRTLDLVRWSNFLSPGSPSLDTLPLRYRQGSPIPYLKKKKT